jgi:hypothetical protein
VKSSPPITALSEALRIGERPLRKEGVECERTCDCGAQIGEEL